MGLAAFVAGLAPSAAGPGFALQAQTEVETVASGLEVPWDLDFAPDGRIFLTERPGRIRVIRGGRLDPEPWARLDVAHTRGVGLLGIAVGPDFTATGHVYVAATFREGEHLVGRIVRLSDRDGRATDERVLVNGLPAAEVHAGGALEVGPDRMLYVTTGDARDLQGARDPTSLVAALLRYRLDGGIPEDNPIPGSPVIARGLRNVQALAWETGSGSLFGVDHGPSGFPDEGGRRDRDELNHLVWKGHYGWPDAAGIGENPRFVDPLVEWTPAIAPAGLTVVRSDPGSALVIVGALRGRALRGVMLERSGDLWKATGEFPLLEHSCGRIRAVRRAPDDWIYFVTSNRDGPGTRAGLARRNDDRLLRFRLATKPLVLSCPADESGARAGPS